MKGEQDHKCFMDINLHGRKRLKPATYWCHFWPESSIDRIEYYCDHCAKIVKTWGRDMHPITEKP